jgi:hypothetical protein
LLLCKGKYEEQILAIQGGQSIYNDDNWTKLPGAAVWAAASIDYSIWCCNDAQEIFRWNAVTSGWDKMPGACVQVCEFNFPSARSPTLSVIAFLFLDCRLDS